MSRVSLRTAFMMEVKCRAQCWHNLLDTIASAYSHLRRSRGRSKGLQNPVERMLCEQIAELQVLAEWSVALMTAHSL